MVWGQIHWLMFLLYSLSLTLVLIASRPSQGTREVGRKKERGNVSQVLDTVPLKNFGTASGTTAAKKSMLVATGQLTTDRGRFKMTGALVKPVRSSHGSF